VRGGRGGEGEGPGTSVQTSRSNLAKTLGRCTNCITGNNNGAMLDLARKYGDEKLFYQHELFQTFGGRFYFQFALLH